MTLWKSVQIPSDSNWATALKNLWYKGDINEEQLEVSLMRLYEIGNDIPSDTNFFKSSRNKKDTFMSDYGFI